MKALSDSLTLPNGKALPNRIAKSAMSERLATREGSPSEQLLRLYERWGTGGAGLLITGNVMVDPRAITERGNVILEDERHLDSLRAWARVAKLGGASVWMQINHPGRQTLRTLSADTVAPSAIRVVGAGPLAAKPRAIESHEIRAIIARFAQTARLAEAAGFDGVQVHGAHGFLVSSFLSPRTNLRQDDWGGCAKRRRRFLLEILRGIRGAVRPEFCVSLKVNSRDFQTGGFEEGESLELLEALDAEGLDLIEISGGTYEAAKMFEEPEPKAYAHSREGFFVDFARRARERVRTPLMVTGGFRTKQGMEDALKAGALDVVGLARPFVMNPRIAQELLGGRAHAHAARLRTGNITLDSMLQGTWYQAQIDRLARGLEPDPNYGRLRSLARYFLPTTHTASKA